MNKSPKEKEQVVTVSLGLHSYEINKIVISKEREGYKLKANPVKNGKLELTFELTT